MRHCKLTMGTTASGVSKSSATTLSTYQMCMLNDILIATPDIVTGHKRHLDDIKYAYGQQKDDKMCWLDGN